MTSMTDLRQFESPDIHSASDGYAQRFAGEAGEWLLSIQEAGLLRMFSSLPDRAEVLDIGGGHGQIAAPLVRQGHSVTVTGSTAACSARLTEMVDAGLCRFEVSDLLNLPFADQSFDVVTCFRIVTHVDDWKRLLAELSRIARVGVIIDYPTIHSLNALTPMLFSLKKRAEGNTRTYRCFDEKELLAEFASNGFVFGERFAQFLFPMVLHRKLGQPRVSEALESMARRGGLSDRWGSPVILKVMREKG